MDAIRLRNVTVAFGGTCALDDVSFTVPKGSCFALVGGSGSGKTTAMRAILGLQRINSGSIQVDDIDVDSSPRGYRRRAKVIQPIFQDPVSSLSPRMRIETLFIEAGASAGLSRETSMTQMNTLFERMTIPPVVADRYPHQISGGQARRVAICRALMMNPRILLADEPTAGLDLSSQGEMMNILQDLRQHNDLTLVIVTHHLAVARLVSDQTAVLNRGQLVECAETSRVFSSPASPYTRRLLNAVSDGSAS